MNTNVGLIGKKLGNTQIFNADGTVARVTAIQVGPCRVLGKRTLEKDGYSALIVGFGDKREKLLTKAELGYFKKIGQAPARDAIEPSAGIVGQALSRPLLRGCDEGFLSGIFGCGEVAVAPDQCAEDPRRRLAQQVLDGVFCAARAHLSLTTRGRARTSPDALRSGC